MSFSSQFLKSQEKSYQRNIATKIHEVMSKLRAGAKSSRTSAKRWVWELIQNAKDVSIDGKVSVLVDVGLDGSDPHVTFKHNGAAFSPENIRFLIEQVSSKDRTNDEEGRPTTTGKFGTGFLTTHLLVEKVVIRGVTEGYGFTRRRSSWLLIAAALPWTPSSTLSKPRRNHSQTSTPNRSTKDTTCPFGKGA